MKKILCSALALFHCAFATETAIVERPEMTVVGIACRTSPQTAMQDIPAHWGTFLAGEIADSIPNKASDEIIALYCDYEGDYTQPYTLVLGCKTNDASEVPEGMVAKIVPASLYAQFTATGDFPESIIKTWGKIWQSHLPRAYTGDYEVYGEAFGTDDKQVDIFISLQD